jgi:predicted PurR-regulated permease PerM
MKSTDPAPARAFDRNAFLILLAVLTVALAAIIWPFYGAVFWGAVLALLFEPLYRKLAARLRNRRTLAALVTLSVILVMVILPLTLVAISLVAGADRDVPARQDRPGQLRHLFRADRRRAAVLGQRPARAARPRRPAGAAGPS